MKQINSDTIKQLQTELLKEFHEYCEKNGLKYCLFFGSLIGAVRHNGFIPWDDDIDIIMNRKDYEYLLAHYNDEHYPQRRLVTRYNTDDYSLLFAKLTDTSIYSFQWDFNTDTGIWLDIFPYDYLPDGKLRQKLFLNT